MKRRIFRLLVLVAIAVGVVSAGAWWWWRLRSAEARAGEPLRSRAATPRSAQSPAGEPLAASRAYPGRRQLDGPAAPDGVTAAALGAERTLAAGHRVKILDYEATRRASPSGADGELVVDAARVEVCAGGEDWTGGALPAAFRLAYPRPDGGFDLRPATSGLVIKKPPLSTRLAGEPLAAGDCRKGWVVFALGEPGAFDDRLPGSILFDNRDLGFVPPEGQGTAAWLVAE